MRGKMKLLLSMKACFAAIEAGALVVCVGAMILDSGLLSIPEGIGIWLMMQPVLLPIALLATPIGALLRMILAFMFERPRKVAMITGTIVGFVGSAFFAYSSNDGPSVWPPVLLLGSAAGLCGGWVWWRIEKPFLNSLDTANLS